MLGVVVIVVVVVGGSGGGCCNPLDINCEDGELSMEPKKPSFVSALSENFFRESPSSSCFTVCEQTSREKQKFFENLPKERRHTRGRVGHRQDLILVVEPKLVIAQPLFPLG